MWAWAINFKYCNMQFSTLHAVNADRTARHISVICAAQLAKCCAVGKLVKCTGHLAKCVDWWNEQHYCHAVFQKLDSTIIIITSVPKVIWELGCVAAKRSPHWLQWCTPNSPPKVPLPMDRSPNPTMYLIPGPIRPMTPNDIRIRSAIFHNAVDRPTDRSSTGKFDDCSPLCL